MLSVCALFQAPPCVKGLHIHIWELQSATTAFCCWPLLATLLVQLEVKCHAQGHLELFEEGVSVTHFSWTDFCSWSALLLSFPVTATHIYSCMSVFILVSRQWALTKVKPLGLAVAVFAGFQAVCSKLTMILVKYKNMNTIQDTVNQTQVIKEVINVNVILYRVCGLCFCVLYFCHCPAPRFWLV